MIAIYNCAVAHTWWRTLDGELGERKDAEFRDKEGGFQIPPRGWRVGWQLNPRICRCGDAEWAISVSAYIVGWLRLVLPFGLKLSDKLDYDRPEGYIVIRWNAKGLIVIRHLHESSSQCWIMTSKFGRKGKKDMLWSITYLHMISPPKWPNSQGTLYKRRLYRWPNLLSYYICHALLALGLSACWVSILKSNKIPWQNLFSYLPTKSLANPIEKNRELAIIIY